MIKLLVADDHAVVRKGIMQIIAETDDIVVAGEARNGREVIEKVRKDRYDLVLLDVSMPGKDGLEVLKELKSRWPKLTVLMLSMYPEEQYAIRALRSGAAGYLTKDHASDELIAAIRKASSGGKYVSSSLAEKLISKLGNDSDSPVHEQLSDREYRIMCMIASGKTPTDIAKELVLSIKTVSTYRTRMLKKMDMKSNAEITRYVIENKLL